MKTLAQRQSYTLTRSYDGRSGESPGHFSAYTKSRRRIRLTSPVNLIR